MFLVARLGVLLLTVAAAGVAVAGTRTPDVDADDASHSSRVAMGVLAASMAGGLLALGVLGWAFLTEDWRFATVVGHARADVPWPLRIAAIWAGPEGSLLLWTTMVAGAALAVVVITASARAGRLLAAITAAYGLVVLTEADPFERLSAPPGTGNGLQPVLEHPAMVWHPPVLYLGLVGLLIPGALAVGAPRRATGISWTLPLALALLTAGLATGANWAYVELGWGGYWAWDPIENAGLVAWLAGASLLHRVGSVSASASQPPSSPSTVIGPWPRSVLMVAVLPGVAAIWATTITRTGVLNSVHAFADRPALRVLLIGIAVAFTGLTVASALAGSRRRDFRPLLSGRSTAGFIVAGVAGFVVAVGTYEPLIESWVDDSVFVISGRFYSMLLWPVAVGGAALHVRALTTAASDTRWNSRIIVASAVGAIGAMVLIAGAGGGVDAAGLILAAAGGAVAGSTFVAPSVPRWASGGRLAHIGIGVLLIGIAGTTASTTQTVVLLTDSVARTSIGAATHRGVELVDSGGTTAAVASLDLVVDGTTRRFQPSLVSYPATGGQSAEVATERGLLSDIQVVLLDADASQATYRISRQRHIALVWLGALLITIGLAAAAFAARRAQQGNRNEVDRSLV